jgi:uncharacterized protein YdeI (YjbR/CyaY-like superfamily)
MSIVHFGSASEFRQWLAASHSTAAELWVGFYKTASGRRGIAYSEAVDEALCFGWIDGLRRKVDRDRYTNRFTPRKKRSTWSLVNVRNAERLIAGGRMHAAGIRAFEARDEKRTGVYSFEKRPERLPAPLERIFRADKAAWAHWMEQPPGYRRTAAWWVISAVREETRRTRLAKVMGASAKGVRMGLLI